MFDTHIHTKNSHDSTQGIDELCLSAIEKNLKAIMITDHIDSYAYDETHNFGVLKGSIKDIEYANSVYGDKIKVLKGVEIGEYHFDSVISEKYCSYTDFDAILGSIHSFPLYGKKIHLSKDDLSAKTISENELIKRTDAYFYEMLKMAQTADIDILCHLTYPMRYINGKYGRGINASLFNDKITEILKTIINRGIALEINTAKLGTEFNFTAPTFDIIKDYYNMGGRHITLGSDAHIPHKIANKFDEVIKLLKEIGFCQYYYFEKREPISVKI